MSFVSRPDGADIFYKDWGDGPPVLFSHGWPLNADSWDYQMLYLATHGFRCVAHDRRGHGRSTQTWHGNDMDTYADDLAAVIETLDLRDVTLVGFSTGGGEVARYIGRHGTSRVAKVVLASAVPPLMVLRPTTRHGVPIEVFDGIRAGSSPTVRSSTRTSPTARSSAQNRPGAAVPRAHATPSGCKGCSRAIATCTSASPRSPRPTSETTWRSSTSPRW